MERKTARYIPQAHEGPRNESSNKAHEPTSGRSTHYGSGHLIRVFCDIEHIFSSPYPFIGGSVSWSLCSVPGTCYSAPNICSPLPELWAAIRSASQLKHCQRVALDLRNGITLALHRAPRPRARAPPCASG